MAHLEKDMKRLTLSIIAVAAVAMSFSSVWAQDGSGTTTKPARHERASTEPTTRKAAEFPGFWAAIPKKLDLTDDQKTKLKTLLDNKQTADNEIQAKLDVIAAEQIKAKDSADKEQITKLVADRKALNAQRRKLEDGLHTDFQALLTPAQQEKYAGYMAYRRNVGQYKAAELSDDQKAKVEAMFEQNAKAYLAAKDDEAARKDLDKKVDEQVRKNVLSKEQIAKIEEARKAREEKNGATTRPSGLYGI